MSGNSSSLPEVDIDASRPVSVVSQPPEEQLSISIGPGGPQAQGPSLPAVDNTLSLLDEVLAAASITLNKVSELRSKANLRTDNFGIKVQKMFDLNTKFASEVSKLRSDEVKARLEPRPPRRRNSESGVNEEGRNHFQYAYDIHHRFQ